MSETRPPSGAGHPTPPARPRRPPRPPQPPAPPAGTRAQAQGQTDPQAQSHSQPHSQPHSQAQGQTPVRTAARRIMLGRDAGEPGHQITARGGEMARLLRPTIRMRLTALYGGMFLIAGVLLLGMVYLLVRNSLTRGQFRVNLPANMSITDGFTTMNPAEFEQWQIDEQRRQRDVALHLLLQQSLLALVLLAVVAFGFGYLMSGRVLRPLERITGLAREVAGSSLHRRIDLDGPDDELKELADTFDGMLDRLDRAFDSQRKFVANASHELRTPLAINRTLLEVALGDPDASPDLRQLGRTLLSTNERSERLIEGLLLLARSDNELAERKPVDLAEVARRAVDQAAAEAAAAGIELRTDVRPATVQGDGVLLERVALNLVHNAVRHNIAGDGWVRVATGQQPEGGVLTVENTGPVVPAYEVENLFEPFRRLRTERVASDRGVGLGLSIVRSVVRAHQGWIEVEPRAEGGLVMRVGLPAA